ncbi:hypothetical protein [Sinorhizobium medicae]|uniref:hypothetical protein n=1 Tax=Sinorhizobium medicae TaxID=110321 RepID=UPI001297F3D2|nr:hypothetical protein [Sinorhizobium medicae]MQX80028.1 hypothetical protein [Sinorhizobium medicae]
MADVIKASKLPDLIELAMAKLLVSPGVVTRVLEVTRPATGGSSANWASAR